MTQQKRTASADKFDVGMRKSRNYSLDHTNESSWKLTCSDDQIDVGLKEEEEATAADDHQHTDTAHSTDTAQ